VQVDEEKVVSDKASIVTVANEDGIKPYGHATEGGAAAAVSSAATEVGDVATEDDAQDATNVQATRDGSDQSPAVKELVKRSAESEKLHGVRQTLESTMDLIKMALRSVDYAQQHPVFKSYLAKKTEFADVLTKSKEGLVEALEFFHAQDIAALKAWLPSFASVLEIAEQIRVEELKKEKEEKEKK
jgi:hypothetical protein